MRTVAATLLVPLAVAAADLPRVNVDRDGERYRVAVEDLVPAPPERVFAVLTDYDHLSRLYRGIRESRRLPGGPPTRVRVESEACLLLFCVGFRQELELSQQPPRHLEALIDPAASDFREGRMSWDLEPEGAGTRLRYQASFVPSFWIPPLVGPWLLRRSLERTAGEFTRAIATLAAGPAK